MHNTKKCIDVNSFITSVSLAAANYYKNRLTSSQRQMIEQANNALKADTYTALLICTCKTQLDTPNNPSGVQMLSEPYKYFTESDLAKNNIHSSSDLINNVIHSFLNFVQ